MDDTIERNAVYMNNSEYDYAAQRGVLYRLLDLQRAEEELKKFKNLVDNKKDISVLMPGGDRLTTFSHLSEKQ